MASFLITLHHLRFFAHHGVFEEERVAGNEFELTISLMLKAPAGRLTAIERTVNYAEVYAIVKELFSKPEALLETLAMDIADGLKKAFPPLKKISVQIVKLHLPITAFAGSVSVTFRKRYK